MEGPTLVPIGESLRAARKRLGVSIEQAESVLLIRGTFLAALEAERFDRIPGTAYVRAWLRQYAEFLGLDSGPFVATYVARYQPPEDDDIAPHQPLGGRHHLHVRLAVALPMVLLLVTAGVVLFLGLTAGKLPSTPIPKAKPLPVRPARTVVHRRAATKATPAPLAPVALNAVGAWDPYGDHTEHDSAVPAATDGNPGTYWGTESYYTGFHKPGVGLILDAGRAVALRRLVVETDTPGYTALIEAGASATGPFHWVSPPKTVSPVTTFRLVGGAAQFYVVWITRLSQFAHVNEIRGLS